MYHNKHILSKSSGFTLLEILVSLAILSIILTGLFLLFMQTQRQFNLTSQGIDVDQVGRSALDYIATEIRNAGARQGKTIAFRFFNGGGEDCNSNADSLTAGTVNSPPDCLKIYSWDISRDQGSEGELNSIASSIETISFNPKLVLNAENWFMPKAAADLIQSGDLVGLWAHNARCDPTDNTGSSCSADPRGCTKCGAILKVDSVNTGLKQISFDDKDSILEQNFDVSGFTDLSVFVSDFYFKKIASVPSEMTLVKSRAFTVKTTTNELLTKENDTGPFVAIAGGPNQPGIVDLQFVFNLQDADGGRSRVGVKQDFDTREYFDFTIVDSANDVDLRGREKDISTVEIYLLVRSRLKPQLLSGSSIPDKKIETIGDVSERNTSISSLGEGFIYKIFSTTIYARNLIREEFG
ncbi:MAG: prepilin-type N-terminal cleavage/methylation domain-containing protein [Candidatus Dadabacteria bacterium]|nr:prepilin-type N-terminal cleavage/methylation domain-containing protein [Candidatus Dadabacteria bacterium]NIS09351.1 prepilin-type N-terminal cleavage/methylation domain-containing protein [Candidatus Dadabacteria bacterium]NIV42361.1 prepilin-type N-terminal cleavage/methylation domain-containing protein [Candidatus Dadabacteria bacterium]NIX15887.1 prepilin-type N-terminal cleavage/methylation domain-containing protein [Candidatus Dadabacteria bacterium]NIY22594.1 prepilin-type N-terminal